MGGRECYCEVAIYTTEMGKVGEDSISGGPNSLSLSLLSLFLFQPVYQLYLVCTSGVMDCINPENTTPTESRAMTAIDVQTNSCAEARTPVVAVANLPSIPSKPQSLHAP